MNPRNKNNKNLLFDRSVLLSPNTPLDAGCICTVAHRYVFLGGEFESVVKAPT